MDNFALKANLNKLKSAKILQYVSYSGHGDNLCEYVFFKHKGIIFSAFLSSLVLAGDKSISEQLLFVDKSVESNVLLIDKFLFNDEIRLIERSELIEFISTKVLMELTLIKNIDRSNNLVKFSYNNIYEDVKYFIKLELEPIEAYINTLQKYNFSTKNVLGSEFI